MPDFPQGDGVPETPQGEGTAPNAPDPKLSELVNRAITARFSAFEKKISQQVTEAVNGLFPKLDELVQTKLQTTSPTAPPDPKSVEESPHVKGLQKRLAELEEQGRKFREERDAERHRARDAALRQRLSDELAKHGVDSKYVRQAVGFLVDAEKRVRWQDDEGEALVFRDADGSELDLSTGLRSWVKTDDAKIYQPPRGASGSGDRGGGVAPKTMQSAGIKRGDIGRALLSELGIGFKASE